jgi:hypothetical protein
MLATYGATKSRPTYTGGNLIKIVFYCYMCEVSLVVALALLNSVTVQRRVSLVTQQYLADNNVNEQNSYGRNNGRTLLWFSNFFG